MRRSTSAARSELGADDDAVGMEEVGDRRALTKKLRIRHHVKALLVDAVTLQNAADPFVGVDRYSALFDDHLVAADGAGDLGDHGFDVGEVGGAGVALGSSDGDEDGLACLDGSAQVRGEIHTAVEVFCQHLGQVLFVNRDAALAERCHLGFVIVDADDAMAHFGKADRGHQADISRADHTDGNGIRHERVSRRDLAAG